MTLSATMMVVMGFRIEYSERVMSVPSVEESIYLLQSVLWLGRSGCLRCSVGKEGDKSAENRSGPPNSVPELADCGIR